MKFRSPTTWSNQLCSLQLGAGHSSQIRSDVSFASPQNLQVDGRDPHHLYRWPSKTMWPVVAYMRVVNSFRLIHLIILFWCVMGVAWFCIVEPCSSIAVFLFSKFFLLISLSVPWRAGCRSWTATALFCHSIHHFVLCDTWVPTNPIQFSFFHMSFADTNSFLILPRVCCYASKRRFTAGGIASPSTVSPLFLLVFGDTNDQLWSCQEALLKVLLKVGNLGEKNGPGLGHLWRVGSKGYLEGVQKDCHCPPNITKSRCTQDGTMEGGWSWNFF